MRLINSASVVIAMLGAPSVAWAQDNPSTNVTTAGEAPEEATGIQDIVVTAQRRSESLQKLPVAITAFDSAALEQTASTGIRDIAGKTPGVTFTQFNVGEPQIFIRGVGSTSDSAGSDPSIGVSVDEVSIGRPGGSALAFLDLERVEVLRGPQGTLYGRNASGGAINIITKRPTTEASVEISGRIGSFSGYGGDVILNGPIGGGVAVRVAGSYDDNHGFAQSLRTGQRLGGGETYGLRSQLLYDVGDWTVLVGGDYSHDDLQGNGRVLVKSVAIRPELIPRVDLARTGLSPRQTMSLPVYQKRENYGFLGRIERHGDLFDFISLTSYRNNDYQQADDLTGSPTRAGSTTDYPISVYDQVDENSHQFSQERRLVSAGNSGLRWVVGLYYFQERVDRIEQFQVAGLNVPPVFSTSLNGNVSFDQLARSKSYAAFGQAVLPFADIWEFTAGARLTRDVKRVNQAGINNDPTDPDGTIPLSPGSPFVATGKASYTKPTWRLALAVEPADGKRLYVSYDRGYKSGSFPSQAQSAAQAATAIKPEYLNSYSLGMKTRWLDGSLQINVDAFYLDYKNLQVNELRNGLLLVTSNANARNYGVEVQTDASLTRNINVGGTYTHMASKYLTSPTLGALVLPYKGNSLTRAPKNQFTLYGQLKAPLLGGGFVGRVDYQWTGDYFYGADAALASKVENFGLLGAYLSWESVSGFKIAAYGKNLTNRLYPSHIISSFGVANTVYAAPRSFGLEATVKF